jgi:uncharacterized membrane-anchored protein
MNTGHVEKTPFWRSPIGLVLCGFLAIGALLVLLEHQAHVLGLWPLLFLLVCGGMHFFMHRGHGGHGAHDHSSQVPTEKRGDDER